MRPDIRIELDRLKLTYEQRGEALRITCPFHADRTASCDVFFDNGRYTCYGCQAAGSLSGLIAKFTGVPQHKVQAELEARYGDDERAIDAQQIERFHQAIWNNQNLRDELRKRAINDETIRAYRLGADGDRVTIPIPNTAGLFVNVRRYQPGSTDGPKFTNSRGRGKKLRLYPFEQIRYTHVALCGGEVKALAVAQALNRYGYGAVSLSGGGEGNWESALEQFFAGKHVFVLPDIDNVGMQAANFRAAKLSGVAEWIGVTDLVLDRERYPHGDVNDYLATHSPEQLLELVEGTREFEFKTTELAQVESTEAVPITISHLSQPEFFNKRVKLQAMVSAVEQQMYYIPKEVVVNCDRAQDACVNCVIHDKKPDQVYTIHHESPTMLSVMESKDAQVTDEIRKTLGIPVRCGVYQLDVKSSYKVVETRIQKTLDFTDNSSNQLLLPAVVVDHDVDLNESYEIEGKSIPHPKTQVATLVVSKTKAVADALSEFKSDNLDDLKFFQPDEWSVEAIDEKLNVLYDYYANNITRIYERPRLHKFVDLTFHSVLMVRTSTQAKKGWLETIVIGDSSQGKTETLERLIEFYGLGVKIECKNATVAGLLGGLENIGGKFFAQWGIIPTHDRRLVVLEELKGLRPEVFSKLTDMRSSGQAQIPKIQRRQTNARTRLVALTNPQGSQTMSAYSYGVTSIRDIVFNPEDIRRFDAMIALNKDDLDVHKIYKRREPVPQLFDPILGRKLILWAWTRSKDQIVIRHDTEELANDIGLQLIEEFSDTIPLIDRGSTFWKVLRFAAAVAARTFSTGEDNQSVVVLPCHVLYAVQLLREEYKSQANGYFEFSRHDKHANSYVNRDRLLEELRRLPQSELVCQRISASHDFDLNDIQDWCGWSRDEAKTFIGVMTRCNAIKREKNEIYRKMPNAVAIFKQVAEEPSSRPEFARTDDEY